MTLECFECERPISTQFVFSMRVYNRTYLGKPLDLDVLAEDEIDAGRVTIEFLESVIGSTFGDEADVSCYSSSIEPWTQPTRDIYQDLYLGAAAGVWCSDNCHQSAAERQATR